MFIASETSEREDDAGVGEIEPVSPEIPLRFSGDNEEEEAPAHSEPSPIVAQEPPQDLLEVSALVAEAQFYRAWAARSSPEQSASKRQRATELLGRAEALLPQDPQVVAERIALEWSRSNREWNAQTLLTQVGNHPATAPLLVLQARVDRETARREQRRLTDATLAELLEAPSRIRDMDSVLAPVFHLQRGLAALSLLDGPARIDTAAAAFTSFRHTVARRAAAEKADREASRDARATKTPRFHEWLQTTTNQRLFGGVPPDPESVRAEDIPGIEQSLNERSFAFEDIEDTIVDRLAYAGV